ncbi:metallocarboxypeptidase ecm14 [Fusarium albosuccineum]|uniref:Inactive metallocarboxypeptidase ECM14 n=2 Tax=Fusarium decemcellulare species complex TaxID=1329916 RepID=A0A8H4L3P1_9HYPO|nr:metallocarboxypeptidase ecm14 [Fusarium albosuccineum]
MKLKILAAALLLLQASDAAGIDTQRPIPYTQAGNTNTRLFPFLTKLRDTAVEFIFGRHPTKDTNQPPSLNQLRAQYANQLVLRFNVTTSHEEGALADAAARLFLDVWAFTEDYVDIRMHANKVGPLLSLLPKSLHTSYSTLIPDLGAVYQSPPTGGYPTRADPQTVAPVLKTASSPGDNLFFQDYQPLAVVIRWMRLLEAMFPSYVEYINIGKSFEGRDMPALRVGVPDLRPDAPRRKTIVVMGGSHAREWISTTTVNYLAWAFITSYGKERMITKLLDEFDIVFIPIANPDGFEYTWHIDRLWRKTRQQTNLQFCRGLDLDRAYGYEWDGSQVQRDPCSESYGGEKPFQAIEAVQIADWARNQTWNNNVRFIGLIDLHSYSQQILYPYSYTCSVDPPNLENLEELAAGIAKSIRLSNGESYTVTSACEGAVSARESSGGRFWSRIESGGGSAVDWFYHEMRAHYSYQLKLRDTGSYGFLLPKEHIVPTGEEIFNAMKYYGDYLLGNNGIEWFPETEKDDSVKANDEELSFSQELRRRRLRR